MILISNLLHSDESISFTIFLNGLTKCLEVRKQYKQIISKQIIALIMLPTNCHKLKSIMGIQKIIVIIVKLFRMIFGYNLLKN